MSTAIGSRLRILRQVHAIAQLDRLRYPGPAHAGQHYHSARSADARLASGAADLYFADDTARVHAVEFEREGVAAIGLNVDPAVLRRIDVAERDVGGGDLHRLGIAFHAHRPDTIPTLQRAELSLARHEYRWTDVEELAQSSRQGRADLSLAADIEHGIRRDIIRAAKALP